MTVKEELEAFHDALGNCGELVPACASRWFSDIMEMFENEFEEILYGEEE